MGIRTKFQPLGGRGTPNQLYIKSIYASHAKYSANARGAFFLDNKNNVWVWAGAFYGVDSQYQTPKRCYRNVKKFVHKRTSGSEPTSSCLLYIGTDNCLYGVGRRTTSGEVIFADNTYITSFAPIKLAEDVKDAWFMELSGGGTYSYAQQTLYILKNNGTLYAMGNNDYNQYGDNKVHPSSYTEWTEILSDVRNFDILLRVGREFSLIAETGYQLMIANFETSVDVGQIQGTSTYNAFTAAKVNQLEAIDGTPPATFRGIAGVYKADYIWIGEGTQVSLSLKVLGLLSGNNVYQDCGLGFRRITKEDLITEPFVGISPINHNGSIVSGFFLADGKGLRYLASYNFYGTAPFNSRPDGEEEEDWAAIDGYRDKYGMVTITQERIKALPERGYNDYYFYITANKNTLYGAYIQGNFTKLKEGVTAVDIGTSKWYYATEDGKVFWKKHSYYNNDDEIEILLDESNTTWKN